MERGMVKPEKDAGLSENGDLDLDETYLAIHE